MDRARVHLNLCNQQLAGAATSFKTHEEHFDYAVSLLNGGQFDQARTHMEKILKSNPKADFAYYGMAVVDCLTGQVESSLKNLGESIRLNPQNRFQARNDSDFQNMADDPRFTELLYPEPTGPSAFHLRPKEALAQRACRRQQSRIAAAQLAGFVLLPSAAAPVFPLCSKASSNTRCAPVKLLPMALTSLI